jgi:hypothetical protein
MEDTHERIPYIYLPILYLPILTGGCCGILHGASFPYRCFRSAIKTLGMSQAGFASSEEQFDKNGQRSHDDGAAGQIRPMSLP